MISIDGLSKSFGAFTLFENISFRINARERVGLVGRNGHGKTTLFRMIAGMESPDTGSVTRPRHYRIGYVTQDIDFSASTVLEEGMRGLPPASAGQYWRVEKILSGLGFSDSDMQRPPGEFSGGYQVRLNLAKVLVSEPDLLLLDEPTNYLDITSIRWIKRFLLTWSGELLLITHDRSFMDEVVTHIIGIHRRTIRKIPGNTEKYYAQIAQDEAVYEKTRINDERRRKEIERFINQFRAKARLANLVQSRVKTLDKMAKKEKLERFKTLDFSFNRKPFSGKYILNAEGVTFGYDPKQPLIRDFKISIGARDRICIVGRNGAGKTTLLKLLAGDLAPLSGQIKYHPRVTKGVFEQTHIKTLVDDRTIEEEILYSNPELDRQAARNICGAMLFEGDSALKKIGVLSGGEKCRVMLGRLLGEAVNFLLLDEPTNHFDMESCDALLAAIDDFDGSVVMVTHNEMFLHAIAERLIVFQADGVSVFDGSYQRFLDAGGWGDAPEADEIPAASEKVETFEPRMTKKDFRRERSAIIAERGKTLKPLEAEIEALESRIESSEEQYKTLQTDLQAAVDTGDGVKIGEISKLIHDCQQKIDDAFERLEEVTAEADRRRTQFDEKLEQIETLKPF